MAKNEIAQVKAETFLKNFIIDVLDFPIPGILFKDITPLVANADAFNLTINLLSNYFNNRINYDYVAGIESRGFWFASALAFLNNKGFIPIRKAGKLPGNNRIRSSYKTEYSEDTIEIQNNIFPPKASILLIDDVLATGGSMEGACRLINRANGCVSGMGVLAEIEALNGRTRLPTCELFSLLKY